MRDMTVGEDAVYVCKVCGVPVEESIEGVLICEDCWHERQMDPEMVSFEREALAYLRGERLA